MTIPKELEPLVLTLLLQGKKVEAVKLVKDTLHCGLKEAKDLVDDFDPRIAGINPHSYAANADQELISLLKQGKKLEAVKQYNDRTGLGLEKSVAYINSLIETQMASPNSGLSEKHVAGSGNSFSATQTAGHNNNRRDTQLDDLVKQQEQKSKSGCFIATACYGDYAAPEVLLLREFRDLHLMTSSIGKTFVNFYYMVSPFLAKQLNRSEKAKHIVRAYFLNPIVKRLSNKR